MLRSQSARQINHEGSHGRQWYAAAASAAYSALFSMTGFVIYFELGAQDIRFWGAIAIAVAALASCYLNSIAHNSVALLLLALLIITIACVGVIVIDGDLNSPIFTLLYVTILSFAYALRPLHLMLLSGVFVATIATFALRGLGGGGLPPLNVTVMVHLIALIGLLLAILIQLTTSKKERVRAKSRGQRALEAISVFEGLQDRVVLLTDDLRIVRMNTAAARIFRVGKDALLKSDFTDLFNNRDADEVRSFVREEETLARFEMIRSDGTKFWADLKSKAIHSEQEEFRFSFVISIHDMTSEVYLTRTHAELRSKLDVAKRLEMIGTLASGVAHDFNNVLAVILANLESLEAGGLTSEQRAKVEAGVGAALSGSDLTKKLLSVAQEAPIEIRLVSLRDIVLQVVEWSEEIVSEEYTVINQLDAGDCMVNTDRSMAANALLNLMINARDAMPDGGKLRIELGPTALPDGHTDFRQIPIDSGDYYSVTISDTGMGIPKSEINKVFEPFYSTKFASSGNGMGLAIVSHFVTQTSAVLQIKSDYGHGTEIRILFPVAETMGKPTGASIASQSSASSVLQDSSRVRGLLVDDNPALRDTLSAFLVESGFDIIVAEDGSEALEIWKTENRFDFVISDVVMPGSIDGWSLVKELRNLQPDLAAILITGHDFGQVDQIELEEHGVELLRKPVRGRLLLASIEAAVSDCVKSDV